MEDYQLRVIEEKDQLDERLGRLSGFFVSDRFVMLPAAEQRRLRRQGDLMHALSAVLGERINAFPLTVKFRVEVKRLSGWDQAFNAGDTEEECRAYIAQWGGAEALAMRLIRVTEEVID